jgi:hypothetical protein
MSGRCVNDVLGGPGRNRTTDTRIFNLSAAPAATPSVCRTKVLLLARSLAWIVTDTITGQTRWRIALRFCLPIPYIVNMHHRRSDCEIRTMDRLRTGRFRSAGAGGTRYLPDTADSPSPHPLLRITQKTGKRQSRGRWDATRPAWPAHSRPANLLPKRFAAERIVRSSAPGQLCGCGTVTW